MLLLLYIILFINISLKKYIYNKEKLFAEKKNEKRDHNDNIKIKINLVKKNKIKNEWVLRKNV